jgi:hypothetical protein
MSTTPHPAPFGDPTHFEAERRRAIFKGVGLGLGGCLVLGMVILLIVIGFVIMVFSFIRNNDAVEMAMTAARSTPEAVTVLGEPIEKGWWVTGSINTENGKQSADVRVPVTGPAGEGVVHLVGTCDDGQAWVFTVLQLQLDQRSVPLVIKPEKIDLP